MTRFARTPARWPAVLALLAVSSAACAEVIATPKAVALDGPEATQQLLVRDAAGTDLTRAAKYESANPLVVSFAQYFSCWRG